MITPDTGACTCETAGRGPAAFSRCTCEWGKLIDALLRFAYSQSPTERARGAIAIETMARRALQDGRRDAIRAMVVSEGTQARVGQILDLSEARVGQLAKSAG